MAKPGARSARRDSDDRSPIGRNGQTLVNRSELSLGERYPVPNLHTLLTPTEVGRLIRFFTDGTKNRKLGRKRFPGGRIAPPTQYVPGPYGPRPVSSRAEEARYVKAYKAGDVEAGKVLALSVAPLIVNICSRWQVPPGVEIEDMIQDAHLAVMQALERGTFNPRKSRLTTWVYRQVIWTCLRVVERPSGVTCRTCRIRTW